MNNRLSIILVPILLGTLVLSSCNNGDSSPTSDDAPTVTHEHTYSNDWSHDNEFHWHDATCGHNVVSNKESHSFRDEVTSPTYERGGYTTHTCIVCDYSYVDSYTDALTHSYSTDWSYNSTGHYHACTDEGYDDLYKDFANHTFSTSIVAPTDDIEGYTLHKCNDCDFSYKDDYTSAANNFVFQLNSDGTGYGVYGYNGEATILNIPSTYNSLPVVSIGYKGFMNNTKIESVVVPDSVEVVGVYAFSGCISLESITLSDNTNEIRDYAFQNCNSLLSIVVPDSVTLLSDSAISGCTSLKHLSIGNGVTTIGLGAFSGLSSLESITLPFIGGDASATEASTKTLFGYVFGKTEYSGGIQIVQHYSTTSCTYYFPASLREVHITGGNIFDYAFDGCSSLTSITILEGATKISQYAFRECSSLTSITIPDSVNAIRYSAFYGCSSLTSVIIPDSVTRIDGYAFYGCSSLTSIVIPDNVTNIANYAFYGCSSLTSVIIPDSVISLGDYAFGECAALTSITIGNGVTSIETNVFKGCKALELITIGNGVSKIKDNVFDGCSSLTAVNVGDENSNYSSEDGVLFDKLQTTLIRCPTNYSGDYVVPNSVTKISAHAFYRCSHLTSITIPDSVTTIGSGAFGGCVSLKRLSIGKGVTTLYSGIFTGLSSLESLVIPSVGNSASATSPTEKTLFGYMFGTATYSGGITVTQYYPSSSSYVSYSYCIPAKLKEVTIHGGKIFYRTFYGCKMIKSITIGSGVTSIGEEAFYSCTSLKSVTISDSVTSIGDYAFYSCSSLTSITIPESVTSIGNYAFYSCSSLTLIVIPDSVSSIGSGAFSECVSLKSIRLPFVGANASETTPSAKTLFGYVFGSVKSSNAIYTQQYYSSSTYVACRIPKTLKNVTISRGKLLYGAFNNCSGLETINLLDGVEYVGSRAFEGCGSLKNVAFGSGVSEIKNDCFGGSFSVTSITISENNPFYSMKNNILFDKAQTTLFCSFRNLYSYDIPNTVTSIGNNAFEGVYSLTHVTIPSSVTLIGDSAFRRCTSLESVAIPDSVTSIGNNAFTACTSLESFSIGSGVDEIKNNIFEGCTSLTSINVNQNSPYYSSIDGVLYNKTQTTLVKCPVKYSGSFTIPSSVTSIDSYAFSGCSSITSVFYEGSVSDLTINSNNGDLKSFLYYYSENEPTDVTYKYWHYVNGVPTAW